MVEDKNTHDESLDFILQSLQGKKREIARGVRSITFYTTEEDEGFYAKNGYSKSDGMIFMGKEL